MKGGILTFDAQGTTLDDFVRFGLRVMDRPVINKTGIQGRFDIRLEYAPDETSSPASRDSGALPGETADVSGPSIFTAMEQQLGLKLVPAKGPGEYIVVDRVEKPTEN